MNYWWFSGAVTAYLEVDFRKTAFHSQKLLVDAIVSRTSNYSQPPDLNPSISDRISEVAGYTARMQHVAHRESKLSDSASTVCVSSWLNSTTDRK